MSDIIVIGGGIVGASAAYRLARSHQASVTLIDRSDLGQATAAGAGIISPGTSVGKSDAFYSLAFPAVAYYDDLLAQLAEDGETQTGYERVGLLHVATSAEEAARLPELLQIFQQRRDADIRGIGDLALLDAREARALFPALGDIHGAIRTRDAARVDGRLLRDALIRAAEHHGASMLHGSATLLRLGNKAIGVSVEQRTLSADSVVIAGGAWSSAFSDVLELALPVYPQRGQILHLTLPDADTSRWPIIVGFHSHYLLTFPPNRVVAGATREDNAGFDYRLTAGGVHEALGEALRVAPGLANATLQEMRIGLRPASPDGLPILGRVPAIENVYVATGHGPSGLQLGPYSGALVADLALGLPLALDLMPFSLARFQP